MTLSINHNLHCVVSWQLLACSADVEQQGRFFRQRDLGRELQQRQRHRVQGLGLARAHGDMAKTRS